MTALPRLLIAGDEQSGCGAGSHTSTDKMVKANRNPKAVIEVDINSNSRQITKRRRNRRRGRAQGFDVARSGPPPRFTSLRSNYASAPIAMGYSVPRGMRIKQVGDIVTISKCEMVEVVSSVTTESFSAPEDDPLIPGALPWLSGVASNFSKWRWRSLVIKYMPQCPTTTEGAIGLGVGYDMAEGTPTSLGQVAAFDQFQYIPFWSKSEDIVPDIGRFSRDWYPYIGLNVFKTASGADQNIYSPGYISEYSPAVTEAAAVGTLWFEYVVDLCDPIAATLQPAGTPP